MGRLEAGKCTHAPLFILKKGGDEEKMNLKEIQDIVKNVLYQEPLVHTEIIGFENQTHRDIQQNGTGWSKPIAYKRWRVVAVGFGVTGSSVAGENPEVEFGILASDLGAADWDYFGSATTFSEGGAAILTAGDVYIKDDEKFLITPDALAAAGDGAAITWDAGAGHLMEWQTKIGILCVSRPNDHHLDVMPFMLVEVEL